MFQINEKPVKSSGLVNSGYDQEKGDKPGAEPWMNNYVPYGKNPSGSAIEQVTFTREDERDGGDEGDMNNMAKDGESENAKEDNESCVPYEETDEDTDEDDSKHEKETVAHREDKADNKDEKDVDEKEVDTKEGMEKL